MHCNVCEKEKDASEFYKGNKTRCKECVKESANKYRQENLERVRAYDRLRGSMPHRVAARREYQETEAYAESHMRANRKYLEAHPERNKARTAVGNAVRDGKLARLPCLICGSAAEAHHPDYSRPLDVVWLCPRHHKQAHAIATEYP
jgi:hypothetical protein